MTKEQLDKTIAALERAVKESQELLFELRFERAKQQKQTYYSNQDYRPVEDYLK